MGSLPIDYNAKHTLSNIFSIESLIDRLKDYGTDGKCILNFSPQNLKDFRKYQSSKKYRGSYIDFNGVGRGLGELKTFENELEYTLHICVLQAVCFDPKADITKGRSIKQGGSAPSVSPNEGGTIKSKIRNCNNCLFHIQR